MASPCISQLPEWFLVDWFERNVELIEEYRPDLPWFRMSPRTWTESGNPH